MHSILKEKESVTVDDYYLLSHGIYINSLYKHVDIAFTVPCVL